MNGFFWVPCAGSRTQEAFNQGIYLKFHDTSYYDQAGAAGGVPVAREVRTSAGGGRDEPPGGVFAVVLVVGWHEHNGWARGYHQEPAGSTGGQE